MSTWNYRVIEFVTPTDTGRCEERSWRAIYEVYYDENGCPVSYTENPAVIGWQVAEGDSAPLVILERIREALGKPVLTELDFHTEPGKADDREFTRKSD